ncbi:MAG: insulinase family protein, partial [Wenzhouxiangellaceae bacterium]
KALVEPGIASRVNSFVYRLPEPSLLLLNVTLPEGGDVERAREVALATLDELAASPPSQEEVQRAVASLTSDMERTLNDSNRVGIGLSEWAATGDWRMLFLHRDRLEQVTVEDVVVAVDNYILRDNRTIGRYIPDTDHRRADIEPVPDAETLLAGYTGREQRDVGEAFEATPENIENRVQRFTLSNGTEVALLPKETRGDRVRASITSRIGSLESLRGMDSIPSATASMLSRGTAKYTRQEIADRIDELQAGLNLSGSRVINATIDTRRENLSAVLDLVAEIARNPVFPESELEEYKRSMLTTLDQQSDDPAGVAGRTISRHFNTDPPDHPDYVPSFEESRQRIESLTAEQLRDFHSRFYGFGPGTTMALVGDFDPDAVREQLESLFGDWTPEVPFQRWADTVPEVAPKRLVSQLDDKASAVLIGSMPMALSDEHPDYPALEMAGYIMGGGFLSSRLGNRIRNEEGLSYAVGGNFNADPIDEVGNFFAFAMFAPENLDRLEEVLNEELVKAADAGFTEEELESARTGFL